MTKERERVWVDPVWKKQKKKEAVDKGLSLFDLTKQEAKEKDPFCLNDKKRKPFRI